MEHIVTDMGTKMCVDPGGNGAEEEVSSWYRTAAETVRRSQDDRRQRIRARHDIKAPVCTEYHVCMYHCILNLLYP